MTTIASDWDDVGAAVDYIRNLRRVERVSLVAWSLGGPRSGGYAARYPEKVKRLVLLAPAYGRTSAAGPPAKVPAEGAAFNTQSRADLDALWARQTACATQVDPAVADVVWSELMQSDPVGATWGPGVRRAPQTTTWGWNQAVVAKMQTPTLMVAGDPRWSGGARARQRALRRSRRHAESDDRSGLLLTQRDVGAESHAAVPCVPRMARQGNRQRDAAGRHQDGLLT